jgi:hypothetical protein
MKRREFLRAAGLGLPALGLASPRLRGEQDEAGGFREITDAQRLAVERGLEWLAQGQYSSGAVGHTCQVAFTSLAGLAFLASNSTPVRGPHAKVVRSCLRFILRCSSKTTGYINEASDRGIGGSGMHGHGYATWFLAELYGMCGEKLDVGDASVKERVQKAVRLIEQSQDSNGGWIYEPGGDGHEGSVTVTQVQALRAARNVGIAVDKRVIDKGIDYIRKSSYPDGTIAYSLGSYRGGTYALTAAGMCVFAMYGLYAEPEVKRGMSAVMEFLTGRRYRGGRHEYYGHLYGGQVCFMARAKEPSFWTQGYSIIRNELLAAQDKATGGWLNDGYGGALGTACAALVLQIPYRYLSIFQD